jgi:hypothetical protein
MVKSDPAVGQVNLRCNDTGGGAGWYGDFHYFGVSTEYCMQVLDEDGTPPLDADSTSAYPSTFPDPDENTGAQYVLNVYLTLTVTSNINLMVKPGVHQHFAEDAIALNQTEYLPVHDAYSLHVVDPDPLQVFSINAGSHVLTNDPVSLTIPLIVAEDNFHLVVDDGPLAINPHVVVADTYHEQFVDPDPFQLGQLHILTVSECYHIHDGPEIPLTQEHNLFVNEAHHLHYVPNLTLVLDTLLAPAETYHEVVTDPVALTEIIDLSIGPTWLEHYGDNISLNIELVVAESANEHYADNIPLGIRLGPVECAHDIVTDPVALTQTHYLTVAEASHEHEGENIDLTEIITLADLDADNFHFADNVPIVVHLIVQESYHEHYGDQCPMAMPLVCPDCYHLHEADPAPLFQLHILEIAGTGQSTDYNYHIMTSDNIVWQLLSSDLGQTHLSIENISPHRAVLIVGQHRSLENITTDYSLRKAA